jgi:hypothetical protein
MCPCSGRNGGAPLYPRAANRMIKRAAESAGVNGLLDLAGAESFPERAR